MLFENIVFGPINSRRLGTSLGINLAPTTVKFCNYDCVYCECGLNKKINKKDILLPSVNEVQNSLAQILVEMKKRNIKLNSITYSGNGEPTLHPHFVEIAHIVYGLRNSFFPNVSISLLTNASMTDRSDIRESLKYMDNVLFKLDCGNEAMFNKLNRPARKISFEKIIDNLIQIKPHTIQTMLLRDKNNLIDNSTKEEFETYLQQLKKIKPQTVMLYSIDRLTPFDNLIKIEKEELGYYAQKIEKSGIEVETY